MAAEPAPATSQDVSKLVDGATYRDGQPFWLWQWMRDHAPLAWHEPGVFPGFWSATRFEDVKIVLRDAATFSSSAGILLRPSARGADPGGGRTLALSDSPRHAVLRDAIARHFSPRHLRTIQASLEAAARSVVKQAVAAETIDFVTDIAATIPVEVVCAFLGLPAADRPAIVRWTNDAFCAGTARERSVAHMKILDYFTALSGKRRAEQGNDLVSVLASMEIGGRLMPVEEIVLNCDNVLVGGTENVRLAMAGGMLALIEHPDQWALLRDRFDEVIDTAIDEILRWTSTATHLMRKATKDTVLGGTSISAGDLVVCWPPSANRDPRQFPDPDVFDIRRSPNRHLALGAGPHYCVGTVLAKMEMRAILRELTDQVAEVASAGVPERLDSIVINGLRALPLRLGRVSDRQNRIPGQSSAERPKVMRTIPSPNIWNDPDVYELENLAIDPEGAIEEAMRSVADWTGLDVVDIGCGTGFHLPMFAETARSVIGVEPHPPLVERARTRVADLASVRVVEAGAQDLPLAGDSADVHHSRWAYFFGPGCEPGLAELERVLRPGGTSFVIDHDARKSPFGRLYRQGWAVMDQDAVERFWTAHGWSKVQIAFRWVFSDRATAEAVAKLEFGLVAAEQVLSAWSGLELEDYVNLWWRRY